MKRHLKKTGDSFVCEWDLTWTTHRWSGGQERRVSLKLNCLIYTPNSSVRLSVRGMNNASQHKTGQIHVFSWHLDFFRDKSWADQIHSALISYLSAWVFLVWVPLSFRLTRHTFLTFINIFALPNCLCAKCLMKWRFYADVYRTQTEDEPAQKLYPPTSLWGGKTWGWKQSVWQKTQKVQTNSL